MGWILFKLLIQQCASIYHVVIVIFNFRSGDGFIFFLHFSFFSPFHVCGHWDVIPYFSGHQFFFNTKNNCDLNDTSIIQADNFIQPNLNCDYNAAVNVSESFSILEIREFIQSENSFFFSDIPAVNTIINDELCCPSSAANSIKNYTCDITLCYLFYGRNR